MSEIIQKEKALTKHSIRIAGHRTSFSLEDAFWDELKLIAGAENKSMNALVAEVDSQRTGNLSSALRLYVLSYIKRRGHYSI